MKARTVFPGVRFWIDELLVAQLQPLEHRGIRRLELERYLPPLELAQIIGISEIWRLSFRRKLRVKRAHDSAINLDENSFQSGRTLFGALHER